jgi:hypothetical protein
MRFLACFLLLLQVGCITLLLSPFCFCMYLNVLNWLFVPDFSTLSGASSTSSESTSVTATTGIDCVRVVFLNRLPFALVAYDLLGFCRSYSAQHCERTFGEFLECTVLALSNLHNGMMLCRWCQTQRCC